MCLALALLGVKLLGVRMGARLRHRAGTERAPGAQEAPLRWQRARWSRLRPARYHPHLQVWLGRQLQAGRKAAD